MEERQKAVPKTTPRARPAKVTTKTPRVKQGAICGNPNLLGRPHPTIGKAGRGCGIQSPVKILAVHGISLSSPAILNCETAQAFSDWVAGSARPRLRRKGGGLKTIHVAASYSCRTINRKKGARLSEHAKGNAIDISGFTLANGKEITVEDDWSTSRYSRAMRKIHQDACKEFHTVLGPKADRYHQDHFHFDLAKRRSGKYCR